MATTDDLLDLRGIGQRSATFGFEVLDSTLKRIGTITPARDTPPSIENVFNRRVKRALRGLVLPPGTASEINPFTDRIRPVMGLENGAGFNMGVFLFLNPTEQVLSAGRTMTADLGDMGLILDDPIIETLSFTATTNMGVALAACFELAGFSPGQYLIDQIDTPFGSDVTWKAGTSLLVAMNSIAAKAGCYSVFFDRDGLGRVRLVQDLATAPITVRYRDGVAGNILRGSIVETQQSITAPNRYLVIDTSANDAPIRGVVTIPASAPNSKEQIGFYRTRVITEQGLPDDFAAVARGRVAAIQDAADYLWSSASGVIDPRHDTFDVIDLLGVRYREQKWGPVQLVEGAVMPHDFRRVYDSSGVT